MEGKGDSGTVLGKSSLGPRSNSKLKREKRSSKRQEVDARKWVNSDEIKTHHSVSLKDKETSDHLKLKDVSECGSSTVPLEKKDPLTVWMEMKKNGFLSSSFGGITAQSCILLSSDWATPVAKQPVRKTKQEMIKKRLELAKTKKEQEDRFTKNAAPTGLLNELNPGIINRLRDRKQVHSIIESLLSSKA